MATLIGDGAHAHDIIANSEYIFDRVVPHHDNYTYDSNYLVIGVNDPRLRDEVRQKIGQWDNSWVHPHAHVERCSVGTGTHINYGVTMTRTFTGHHCTISPGVTICGDVSIGDRTLIGAGATICDRVTIGNDVTIGAGAVVLPESVIPDGETWVGVPARVLD